ncbi:MAG: hypothetical protein WC708_02210 [Lentisphaeria bacterium]
MTIRQNLLRALAGQPAPPVYLAYDWFIQNRAIDWTGLFQQGLGRINHASLIRFHYPHLQIVESESVDNGRPRRDVRWITDLGELHEYYLDGWKQQHFIRTPEDYRIARRAFEDAVFTLDETAFAASEQSVGEGGITLGQFGAFGQLGFTRTPFQVVQIDLAGLEQFSLDIASDTPELLDLLAQMNDQLFQLFRLARPSRAGYLKLWENLSIETMGPRLYRTHLVPVYEKIFEILGDDKKLIVHYDGKLSLIADAIARLPFHGLDSLTPPPEGDLTIAQARAAWPDKFFWIHPTLSWDSLSDTELAARITQTVRDAGGTRCCLELSEEVPPNWPRTVPLILDTLRRLAWEPPF